MSGSKSGFWAAAQSRIGRVTDPDGDWPEGSWVPGVMFFLLVGWPIAFPIVWLICISPRWEDGMGWISPSYGPLYMIVLLWTAVPAAAFPLLAWGVQEDQPPSAFRALSIIAICVLVFGSWWFGRWGARVWHDRELTGRFSKVIAAVEPLLKTAPPREPKTARPLEGPVLMVERTVPPDTYFLTDSRYHVSERFASSGLPLPLASRPEDVGSVVVMVKKATTRAEFTNNTRTFGWEFDCWIIDTATREVAAFAEIGEEAPSGPGLPRGVVGSHPQDTFYPQPWGRVEAWVKDRLKEASATSSRTAHATGPAQLPGTVRDGQTASSSSISSNSSRSSSVSFAFANRSGRSCRVRRNDSFLRHRRICS